jgi:hypothetical protein
MGSVAWGAKVSRAFVAKVEAIAADLGCHPDDLMACMAFESGETFSPSIRNKVSGATGLIQFMKFTAPKLGTTTDALAAMTPEEQLDYVAAYFKPYNGWLHTLEDLYMAILWPKAIGRPNSVVLFDGESRETALAYTQNKGLDVDHDGRITKAEAARKVREKLARGELFRGEGYDADVPFPEPRPADAPAAIEDDVADLAKGRVTAARELTETEVKAAQQLLHDLKYYEVGLPDGDIGSRTIAAVAAFKHDRGLIGEPVLDRALVKELDDAQAEGWARPIAPERAEGKPDGSRVMDAQEKLAAGGLIATVTAAISKAADTLSEWFEPVRALIDPLRPMLRPLGHFIAEHWHVIAIGVGGFVLWQSGRAWFARRQDHREGKTT